jgi:hypothetical protein
MMMMMMFRCGDADDDVDGRARAHCTIVGDEDHAHWEMAAGYSFYPIVLSPFNSYFNGTLS